MTGQLNLFLLPRCLPSSPSLPPTPLIQATFCLCSCDSTLKSPTSVTDSNTKATSQNHKMAYTASATNPMSKRNLRTRAFPSPTSLPIGMSYAQKVCYSQIMSPIPFFAPHPSRGLPMAWSPLLISSRMPVILFKSVLIPSSLP